MDGERQEPGFDKVSVFGIIAIAVAAMGYVAVQNHKAANAPLPLVPPAVVAPAEVRTERQIAADPNVSDTDPKNHESSMKAALNAEVALRAALPGFDRHLSFCDTDNRTGFLVVNVRDSFRELPDSEQEKWINEVVQFWRASKWTTRHGFSAKVRFRGPSWDKVVDG